MQGLCNTQAQGGKEKKYKRKKKTKPPRWEGLSSAGMAREV